MNSLIQIDPLARALRERRDNLANEIGLLNSAISALQQHHLPAIKRLVAGAAGSHADLSAAIDESRALFTSTPDRKVPRTVVMHGIKLGLRKGTGGIDWDDDQAVADRIEKRFPKAKAEILVKTTKKPQAKALQELDAADLKALGCRVEDTGDQIVIAPVDSAVDKLVNALLESATDQIAEEQEAA